MLRRNLRYSSAPWSNPLLFGAPPEPVESLELWSKDEIGTNFLVYNATLTDPPVVTLNRQVTPPHSPGVTPGNIAWSSDGRYLSYSTASQDFHIYDAEGTNHYSPGLLTSNLYPNSAWQKGRARVATFIVSTGRIHTYDYNSDIGIWMEDTSPQVNDVVTGMVWCGHYLIVGCQSTVRVYRDGTTYLTSFPSMGSTNQNDNVKILSIYRTSSQVSWEVVIGSNTNSTLVAYFSHQVANPNFYSFLELYTYPDYRRVNPYPIENTGTYAVASDITSPNILSYVTPTVPWEPLMTDGTPWADTILNLSAIKLQSAPTSLIVYNLDGPSLAVAAPTQQIHPFKFRPNPALES